MSQETIHTSNNISIYFLAEKKAILVEATNTYIPIDEFKEAFNMVETYVKENFKLEIDKIVFDKRKLTVFHQPSMEWYMTEWKDNIYHLGLRTIRKILPDDKVFRYSVKIGREKIDQKYPNAKYHQMDIQYRESLEAAFDE